MPSLLLLYYVLLNCDLIRRHADLDANWLSNVLRRTYMASAHLCFTLKFSKSPQRSEKSEMKNTEQTGKHIQVLGSAPFQPAFSVRKRDMFLALQEHSNSKARF